MPVINQVPAATMSSSKREADEIDGEHQPGLKIAKTEVVADDVTAPSVAVGAGTVTHNPISAYEDEDILASHHHSEVGSIADLLSSCSMESDLWSRHRLLR